MAAQNGHVEAIAALLQAGANKDAADKKGWTPLHIAALKGHVEAIAALLQAGANKDAAKEKGWTPLHIAAQNGHVEAIAALLQADANKDAATKDGATPLHVAAQNGHVEAIAALLQAGANKDAATKDGATPLYMAAQNGHNKAIAALLQAGANKDAATKDGSTPIRVAAYGGHVAVMRALLLADGVDVESEGCWTLLHLACLDGDLARVKQLLQQGAPVDAAGKGGWTPLHLALCSRSSEVAEQLLNAGASASQATDGDTPLHNASYYGQTGIVQALLRAGAPLEARNNDGLTPLHGACQGGHRDVVEALLRDGADHEAKTRDGKTPLDLAVAEGFGGLAERLLQHAADMATSVRHGFWSTHAIFMSPDAVYITVYNSRDNGQAASVDAYIERVQTLAPGALNMVVGAWADEGYTGLQPPATALRGYKNPVSVPGLPEGECLCLSSKMENGIPKLKQAIMELTGVVKSASILDVVRLPEVYVRLRDNVRSLRDKFKKENKLRLVSLKDIMGNMEAELPQEADLHRFLSKLSDFGELLRFQHVPGLEDKVVIDPEWLADVLGDVVTSDKDKQQRLQLLGGRIGMSNVHKIIEARCPDHANELVRILEAYGLLYDLGDGERAIIPPMLPTLAMDDAEKLMQESPGPDQPSQRWWGAMYNFEKHLPDALLCRLLCRLLSLPELRDMELGRMWRFGVFLQKGAQRIVVAYDPDQRSRKGALRVVACGPEPELRGLLVASQLAQVQEQFPGVRLSSVKYDCPECLGCKGSDDDPGATTRCISAKVAWNQKRAEECEECGKHSDMSMYALDEQAVDWWQVKEIRGESEGTRKLHRSLGAMERVVERVKDLADGTALIVAMRKSLVRRAVALHKLVGPSGGERLPLAVLLPALDDGASNHKMELDLDGTTSGLPGRVRLHALCEYPGGLHLTGHGGYEVMEGRAWLRTHGRGLRPLLRALQLVGVSGPVGPLGAGDPEVEAMYGGQEMQRTHSRGRSGGRVTGWGEGGPTEQLDSMLACLDRLVEQQDAQLRSAAVTPAAEGKGGIEGKPADQYSACQEACSSVVKIVQQGNMEAAAGGMPRLQRVVTRTAGAMWLCACHAEELDRMPLRSL
ncbi:hypothetical protein GPECTOR_66g246 [Gonium pectorale]|uniref:Uncharacterized protein n=1 Tax=Gonium pectorale TaxID=33097 RepID=A0A150G3W2_GONPE|nr:hypothetical protein GPECTOR_66g246 [Gonium pectorale]|eukprot:KXZ44518.1 hypothetical protein GPECTOR_66g246 [Gonium pectorale]